MKILELWRWIHTDPATNKRIKTRYMLTAEDAKARLVEPERVAGTRELRRVPASPNENHMTGAFLNKPG